MSVRTLAAVLCAVSLASAAPGVAQDGPIELMAGPTPYTDVADAFDGADPFDINVRLGFAWSSEGATIQRERTDTDSADGRPGRRFVDVADYERTRSALEMALELGLYHDLMLTVGLPLVLSEQRDLLSPSGVDCAGDPTRLECERLTVPLADGGREALFDLRPLRSAKRSGLPELELGLVWGVINQHRGDGRMATWVLRTALTLPLGDVMQPCVRDGVGCRAGISDGQAHLQLESRWSYRFRYVEPQLGIAHRFAWIASGEGLYSPAGALEGVADDTPPTETSVTVGAAVIPWEDRGRHQRFALDTRASATFVSAGRDVSPLFDALGTSDSAHLTADSVADLGAPASEREAVAFTGITRVAGHARLSLRTALVIQAAQYVRFDLGMGVSAVTAHLLTGEPACNTEVEVDGTDPSRGRCIEGLPDPAHRPAIDAPGQRFQLADDLQFDLFAGATGQF